MPKRVEDIVINKQRSIRDISIDRPARRTTSKKIPSKVVNEEPDFVTEKKTGPKNSIELKRLPMTMPLPPKHRKARRSTGILVFLGTIVIIAGLAYVASIQFAKATFNLIPRTIPISIDGTYVAKYGEDPSSLSYGILIMTEKSSVNVPAVDGQPVSLKAQGKVTIYNSYSAQPQKLIAGTRIANDSDRIYRLSETIVVPGYTKSSSGIIPGKYTASVVADQSGQSYNISAGQAISDLKIVAFKGTPRYDSFYARPVGAIDGGFSGVKKTVTQETLASTTAKLKEDISQSLEQKIRSSLGQDKILYQSGLIISYSPIDVGGEDVNVATVSIEGTAYAVSLDKNQLIKRIAGEDSVLSFGSYGYEPVGIDSLDFSISNPVDFSPTKKDPIIFKLQGNISLQGKIPVEEISDRFAGTYLSESDEIFRQYQTVIDVGSYGELIPPWITKVPRDASRIVVKIKKP